VTIAAVVAVGPSGEENSLLQHRAEDKQLSDYEPFVYADGEDNAFVEVLPGKLWKRQLVGKGRVPYMNELSEYRLSSAGDVGVEVPEQDPAVYFGLEGRCTLSVGDAELIMVRGAAATVFPGAKHHLSSGSCLVLHVGHDSKGNFSFGAPWPSQSYVFGDALTLPAVKTAHVSDLLSKKVYLAHGVVPGLFQVSLARFAPGAECEEHFHETAAEVYVNFDGHGCHLQVQDKKGTPQIYNLSGGKVAIINPGTLHSAWNDASAEACQNINMMMGPPNE